MSSCFFRSLAPFVRQGGWFVECEMSVLVGWLVCWCVGMVMVDFMKNNGQECLSSVPRLLLRLIATLEEA